MFPTIGVIDGPFDTKGVAGILARQPTILGEFTCDAWPGEACVHGTFVIALLAAKADAVVPGLCPQSSFLHVPIFSDGLATSARVETLATAIVRAVDNGADLINLSLA